MNFEELHKEIKNKVSELNQDANSRWENQRIITNCDVIWDGTNGVYKMTLGIGKWETSYLDITFNHVRWNITSQSVVPLYRKQVMNDVNLFMDSVIMPLLYNLRP